MTGRVPPAGAAGAGSATGAALKVREVTSLAGLQALAADWEAALAASETRTPFLTHDWAVAWWESFGAGRDLAVLVIEDADGIAGIAPLVRSRLRAGPVAYRSLELLGTSALRFLGMGLADRADLLLARRREACVERLLGWLDGERASWDVLDLRFVPEGATTARRLAELAPALGLGHAREACSESPWLALDGTWEDYLERRGRNFRKGLKRRLRALEEQGPVELDLDAGERDPGEALAEAVATSLASWKEREGTALFQHASVRAFWQRLAPRLAARGRLYVSLLRVGGETAAHELGFRLDGKLWSYDSAFRPAFAAGSPGTVLTAAVLERAYRDGLSEYDFMRGNEGYKTAWSAAARREVQVVLDSGRLASRTARELAFRAKWALKRRPWLVAAQGRLGGLANRLLQRRAAPHA